jgi:hypothetical protein
MRDIKIQEVYCRKASVRKKRGLGMVVHAYNPSLLEGRSRKITSSKSTWAKLVRCYLKNKIQTKQLGAWGIALLSMRKALSYIPSSTKKIYISERNTSNTLRVMGSEVKILNLSHRH